MFNQSIKQIKDYELQSIDSLSNKSIAESEAHSVQKISVQLLKWQILVQFSPSFVTFIQTVLNLATVAVLNS